MDESCIYCHTSRDEHPKGGGHVFTSQSQVATRRTDPLKEIKVISPKSSVAVVNLHDYERLMDALDADITALNKKEIDGDEARVRAINRGHQIKLINLLLTYERFRPRNGSDDV